MIKTHHRVGLLLVLVWALVPLAILAAMMLAQCWRSLPDPGDAAFESLVDLPMNTGLYVSSYRRRHSADDHVHLIVQNQSGELLWFEDQSFGVRGFVYDDATQQWAEIDLGFELGEPVVVCLGDSERCVDQNLFSFPTRWMDIRAKITIRLLVVGSTCPPEQQGQSDCQRYAAYTDIIVDPGR